MDHDACRAVIASLGAAHVCASAAEAPALLRRALAEAAPVLGAAMIAVVRHGEISTTPPDVTLHTAADINESTARSILSQALAAPAGTLAGLEPPWSAHRVDGPARHSLVLVGNTAGAAAPWGDPASPQYQLIDFLLAFAARLHADAVAHRDKFLLDSLLNNITDAVYFKDEASRFLRASADVVRRNNFASEAHLLGKTDFDLFLLEHARDAFHDEQQIIRTGQPVIAKEEKETRPDGSITWALTTKLPLRDTTGRIIGTMGISKDITQLRAVQDALRRSEEELTARYKAMESDLERARAIQHLLLPSVAPSTGKVRSGFRYQSVDAVGGDFFSFNQLGDDALGFFLGDLTGHGVAAALFMSLVKTSTERVFELHPRAPAEYLRRLDALLRNQIPFGFVTAIYGMLHPLDGGGVRFTHSNAGHPEPIVLRAATGRTEVLPEGIGALGLFDNIHREEQVVDLQPGDRLFVYTDGIPECTDPEGRMLGFQHFPEVIRATRRDHFEDHLDAIIAEAEQFRGGLPADDDIALVGFEVIA